MNATVYILGILLQAVAGLIALWQVRYAPRKLPWLLIAISSLLIVLRRASTLGQFMKSGRELAYAEILTLIISLLFFLGVVLMSRMFQDYQRDQNDLRQAEASALKSSQLLNAILQHTHMMTVYLDPQFNFIWVNRAYAETCGHDPSFFPGRNHFDLYPHVENRAIFQRVVDSGEPFFVSAKPFSFPDQPERGVTYWDWSLIPVKNDSEQVSNLVFTLLEVTENVRQEEELKLKSLVLDQIHDHVTITDMKGYINYVNQAQLKTFGCSKEEIIGRSTCIYGEDAERGATQHEILEKTLNYGSWRGEVVNYTAEGIEHVMDCRTQIIYNTDGIPIVLSGIATDITEQKKIEASLKASEQRYREVVEGVGSIILRWDNKGCIRYMNNYGLNLLGYEHDELIGSHVVGTIVPVTESTGRDLQVMIEQITQNPAKYKTNENENISKTGDRIWISWSNQAILDDNQQLVEVLSVGTDIREHKAVEDRLKKSEAKLSALFSSMSEMVVLHELVFDKDNKPIDYFITDCNETFAKEMRLSKEAIIGKHATELYGTNKPPYFDEYCRVATTGVSDAFEVYFEPIGKFFHISVVSPEKNLFATVTTDITESKRMELARRELEERPTRAEKMEALGTLAGGVAHDLNNVLGVVVAFAELLLDKIGESSPLRSYVKHIMDNSDRAAAIVDDLLTLARRGVQTEKVFNLNAIVEDYLQTPDYQKLLTHHHSVYVEVNLDRELLNIKGSPIHLTKSIMNLVTNGMEAMPQGGCLTITTFNQYLDRPFQGMDEIREGDYVVLSVSDKGEGISKDETKKIFEPFYTTKSMGKSGTGLGLSVVWGMVKDHNGYIDVQSKVGEGSTFTLYFPVSRSDVAKQEEAVPVSEYMGNGEAILVVDDVHAQREAVVQILNKLNYQAESVSSGEEAVDYVKGRKPDLIVLDMIMDPGIDGLETYKRITAIHPQQKAIIVSGYAETDKVKQAMDLGAGAFVHKPYVLEKLGVAIRKELDRI
jgi:PAS domain S-box-containing protein